MDRYMLAQDAVKMGFIVSGFPPSDSRSASSAGLKTPAVYATREHRAPDAQRRIEHADTIQGKTSTQKNPVEVRATREQVASKSRTWKEAGPI